MSKIHEALRKLQDDGAPADARARKRQLRRTPSTAIPVVRKKGLGIEGPKEHVDEQALIRGGLLAPLDQAIPVADEFRRIKRPLIDNFLNAPPEAAEFMSMIVVTSAMPGVGKTFCAVNLAASISLERELSVLLVDADVASPKISTSFGFGDRPGLVDLLEEEELAIEDVLVRTDLNDIQILPAGRKHRQSTELLASERMATVMHELATRYPDRIIVADSPPLLATSEAQVVARKAGQIALVLECGKTEELEVHEAVAMLRPEQAVNAILNKSIYSQSGAYYGGGYGGYGFNEEE